MKMCSGKAFFESGHSIGWDALEDTGDDLETARHFVEGRVLPQAISDETVEVHLKDQLGAPVRSSFRFQLRAPVSGEILGHERLR